MKLEYKIKKEDNGKTINQIMQEQFKFSNKLQSKIIKNKNVLINKKIVDTRQVAKASEVLEIDLNYEEDNSNILSKKMILEIIYEDDAMLILNKPAGIAVHPSIRHYENSLASGVKYYFERKGIHKKIRPVNRLDLNTSGIIIYAKNEYVQESLIKQMEKGIFQKEYLAIVEGNFANKKGIIDAPIARKEESIIERCISKDGKKAVTKYEVIKEKENYSLIKCNLLTGRTHQIRIHMAYIGHPIVGDTLYGKKESLIERHALHSYKVSFIHPITKEKVEFEAY